MPNFALNGMVICDQRQAIASKETMLLDGIDIALPNGIA